ncbi:MAG: DUF3822 family protein [Flavobacteriales bacterium]|nr:DUF3822 family protein [Flavobacteriales bacterium]NCG29077.1 DUF3822 family protein [Bacteroidota bacterium]MBT3963415.1 DUF3822 family protein [Flavobacteriales bacterium]MBT4704957.1 DUF3822 family protein [Flavobacteriales bacterium]MBT4929732.1 DUF3822 family protein [Flavobacteriales bacterium]
MKSVAEKLEFFDLSFTDEPASYYYLIVELDDSRVKLMWYHLSKNLVTGFATYPLENESFDQWLKSNPQLKSDYKEVIVCVRTDNYLLNPRGLVDGTDHEIFTVTNTLDTERDALRSFRLVNVKADYAFPISKRTDEAIHSAFSHLRIIPHTAPMVERTFNLLQSRQTKTLLKAHVNTDSVDILAFKEGKLLLVNSYFQTTKEDIAYYVLYAAEILDYNPEQDILEVSGDVDMGDESWNLLSEYWKRLELVAPLDSVKVSPALQGYDPARFDYLTHALLCVS